MDAPAAVRLSRRVRALQPSPTLAVEARVKELLRAGADIVGFGAGEPDFPTPEHVKEAARAALREDRTRYTVVAGVPELREAICRKLERENGLRYAPDEVLVSAGSKHALFNAVAALCEEGDEVLIPSPYWVSYPEQVRYCGGVPVFVPTDPERGFRPRAADVAAALTPRSRLLILNSPNNPTGAVAEPGELQAIARLAVERDLWVISDEIYEHIVYEPARHVSIAAFPGMRERTVVVGGVSKAYAMTGWRLGWAAGPRPVIRAMADLQGQVTSNASTISQYAALAALEGPQEPVRAMVAEYRRRRDYALARLRGMPGMRCTEPDGAFYLFVSVEGLLGRRLGGLELTDGDAVAAALLEHARVAVVPGSGFGLPGYIRISYACSLERLREGLDRIEAALRQVSG